MFVCVFNMEIYEIQNQKNIVYTCSLSTNLNHPPVVITHLLHFSGLLTNFSDLMVLVVWTSIPKAFSHFTWCQISIEIEFPNYIIFFCLCKVLFLHSCMWYYGKKKSRESNNLWVYEVSTWKSYLFISSSWILYLPHTGYPKPKSEATTYLGWR